VRGIVVVAIGAALIWIGLSTDESGVDASEVAEVRADGPTASSSGAPEGAAGAFEALPPQVAPEAAPPEGSDPEPAPQQVAQDPSIPPVEISSGSGADGGEVAPAEPEPTLPPAEPVRRPDPPSSDSFTGARRGAIAESAEALAFDGGDTGSTEVAQILLEAWITEQPAALGTYMTEGDGTSLPAARQQLIGGFWEALIGKVDAAQQRFDAIRGLEGVTSTQLALLAAAIAPPGNRAVPRVASAGRIEPLALSMQMILLGDEARSLMELRDYGRSAVAWSDLIQMELRAPWAPHRSAIQRWGASLKQAQGNHRFAKGGNWPSYDVTVSPGEYLTDIRKRALRERQGLLICTGLIEATNGLVGKYHHPGDVLRIPTDRANVIVDLDARAVLYRHGDEVVQVWECGIGKDGHETPLGTFTIGEKLEKPVHSTRGLPYGHPENPLGSRWLALLKDGQNSTYGIHGTSDPSGVGGEVSLGCIRMRNEDVNELFEILPRGAEVIIQS